MKESWWKESVAYQIYPRSFADSNGDGIGDLRGIIQKLDYLETLGVDLLWITPIFESPDVDNGYDISNYQAINPTFGTLEDLEELVEKAHNRNIRIMLDLVINHTSDKHQWFIESRKSRENPYRDFYIWRDGKNGREPNNWKAHFSKSAWTLDKKTNQYYLHTFSPYQPDLNWKNPRLRQALYEMIKWWLAKGIDGFRLDAISFISKQENFPDHAGSGAYIFHRANMMHGPDYHSFLHELNRAVWSHHDVVTAGECIDLTVESAIEVSAPERQEIDMPFLFEHTDFVINHGMNVSKLKEILTRWQIGLHNKAWLAIGFNNHDLPRVVSTFGNDKKYRELSAKLFGTLLLTLNGTPFIYQGEEIGMTNVSYNSIVDFRDLAAFNDYQEMIEEKGMLQEEALAELRAKGRDNSRTPMQWNDTKNAGFSTGTPWIKVNSNYKKINVAQAIADPNSVFSYYQQLITLRKRFKSLVYGRFDSYLEEHQEVFVFSKKLEKESFLIILNLTENFSDLRLPNKLQFRNAIPMISNYAEQIPHLVEQIRLRPYEAVVYQLAGES